MPRDCSISFLPASVSDGVLMQRDVFLPAAGYRNGSDLNNAGNNGHYWSRSLNEGNANNAYELNFNSDNVDWNNNNRNNGQSVRPVLPCHSTYLVFSTVPMAHPYLFSRNGLLADLYVAYLEARRHKRFRLYQLQFEANLMQNLNELFDELISRTYKPRPSTCFIIQDPKKREVFAADFRDRIVHHLYYNYTHEFFERTFIADSYSCIKGRGTHYGIARLEHHIRQASLNYTERAYALQMDIKGYFMHIDRQRLLDICLKTIDRYECKASSDLYEQEKLKLVRYLTEEIVMLDPIADCKIKGRAEDWQSLPHDKSLFHSPHGCGLPIGNLTSQLFSNIYMNVFDQFMKRQLAAQHYGRYVDDFYVVSPDKDWLRGLIPLVSDFLSSELALSLNEGKTMISEVHSGVSFLGAYLKPWRKYVRNETLGRMRRKVALVDEYAGGTGSEDEKPCALRDSLSSFGGVLGHYKSFKIRQSLFLSMKNVQNYGSFDSEMLKFVIPSE